MAAVRTVIICGPATHVPVDFWLRDTGGQASRYTSSMMAESSAFQAGMMLLFGDFDPSQHEDEPQEKSSFGHLPQAAQEVRTTSRFHRTGLMIMQTRCHGRPLVASCQENL